MSIATYPAPDLAPASTQLGYTDIPAFTGIVAATTVASVSVYVPAGRRIKVTAHIAWNSTVAGDMSSTRIYEDGVHVGQDRQAWPASNVWCHAESVLSPSPGVHTYTVTVDRSSGTGTIGIIDGTGTNKASWLLVEDITGGTGGPGPIVLAYEQLTTAHTGIGGTLVNINGLSATVNVPAGRTLRVTGRFQVYNAAVNGDMYFPIKEDGIEVGRVAYLTATVAGQWYPVEGSIIMRPSAGAHTYSIQAIKYTGGGTLDIAVAAANPGYILVEDITGTPSPAGILPTSQTLGYAQVTSAASSSAALVIASVTITVPAGRRIRLTGQIRQHTHSVLNGRSTLGVWENGVHLFGELMVGHPTVAGNAAMGGSTSLILSPSAGTHTYSLVLGPQDAGTVSYYAAANDPAYILAEDITGGAPAVAPNNVPAGRLGYAEYVVAGTTPIPAGAYDLPGLSVNVVVPEGRTLKISHFSCMNGGTVSETKLYRGATQLNRSYFSTPSNQLVTHCWSVLDSPPAGSHTYKAQSNNQAAGTLYADGSNECYLLVEDVTPTPAPANTAPSSTLGYAERTGNILNISAEQDLTNLTTTVTVPAGRRLRITGFVPMFTRTAGTATYVNLIVNEDGANKQRAYCQLANNWCVGTVEWITSPAAGTHTYKLRANSDGTVAVDIGNSIGPAFILVEDITGVSVDVHDHNSGATAAVGYAQLVSGSGTLPSSATDVPGLSVTVALPAGRRIRVSGRIYAESGAGSAYAEIREGGRLHFDQQHRNSGITAGGNGTLAPEVILTPSAGVHTYTLAAGSTPAGGLWYAGPTYPAYLLVEDITGHGIPGHTHPQLDGIIDSGWLPLSLINGWVSYDGTYGPPRYRKLNGVVYVQGLIRSGTLGVSCAQLPVGFRPSLPKLLFGTMRNANVEARIDVQSDGHLIMALADPGWITLSGITFPADQ